MSSGSGSQGGFSELPKGNKLDVQPWECHVSDIDLETFQALLKLSKIGPKTYENQTTDAKDFRGFGIRRDWLEAAKHEWETNHDWRKAEQHINKYPNWMTKIEAPGGGYTYDMHFMALFSKKSNVPSYLCLHGWPGSVMEFLGVLDELSSKYTPDTLPFNIVVPSLPGYGFSSGPRLDKDTTLFDSCKVVDDLMIGLGLSGYICQGGDVGAFMCRVLGAKHDAVKAVHLNYCLGADKPEDVADSAYSDQEKYGMKRTADWIELGSAYAREHGTRPATVGLTLSSSPIALLSWIGEKFIAWSDQTPPLQKILDAATLYWFTESFPRAIYPYRHFFGGNPTFFQNEKDLHITKPVGYSYFPQELAPIPKKWVERTCNLIWYRQHTSGGHFAAFEKPKEFAQDLVDFVEEVGPRIGH